MSNSSDHPDEPGRLILEAAWNQFEASPPDYAFSDRLAAYLAGTLAEEERVRVEARLANDPALVELLALWNPQAENPPDSELIPAPPTEQQSPETRIQKPWFFRSATRLGLTAALVSGALVMLTSSRVRLNRVEFRLAQSEQARLDQEGELYRTYKKLLVSKTTSLATEFWIGETSPDSLAVVQLRSGPVQPTPEAAEVYESADALLNTFAEGPRELVERASLTMLMGRFEQTQRIFEQAPPELLDHPEVQNTRAIWLASTGDVEQSLDVFAGLNRTAPEYLPGWYNHALLLQRNFQDDVARTVWAEYLQREQRPRYRAVAESHLQNLE